MLESFDLIFQDQEAVQVRAGGEAFELKFDKPEEYELFKAIVDFKGRSYKKLMKRLLTKFEQGTVLSFFQDLKSSGILYFEDDGLLEGRIYDLDIDEFNNDRLSEHRLGLITEGKESQLERYLSRSDLKSILTIYNSENLKSEKKIVEAIKREDFIIFDASAWNPVFLDQFNTVAIREKKPWLLVEGAVRGKGFLGPLFLGRETGCYHCFLSRVKSNLDFVEYFVDFERHLREKQAVGKRSRADQSFTNIIGAMVVLEVKKYLLEIGFPQSYGSLIQIDFDGYETSISPLYKLPLCPHCEPQQDYRRAPWLDEITLAKPSLEHENIG